jgi:hypothetical protein
MKKVLSIVLGIMFFCNLPVFCEEVIEPTNQPTQVIEIEKSGAVAILQKQPTAENQMQVIKIKKSGGFLLIQINGKVKDSTVINDK